MRPHHLLPLLAVLGIFGACRTKATATRSLGERLLSTEPGVSAAALQEMDDLADPARKNLLPGLQRALADRNTQIRANAACAIAHLGPSAASLLPALKQRLKVEKEAEPRVWLVAAVMSITHPVVPGNSADMAENPQIAHLLNSAKSGELKPQDVQTLTDVITRAKPSLSDNMKTGKAPPSSTSELLHKIATPEVLAALKTYASAYSGMAKPHPTMTDAQIDTACRNQWKVIQQAATESQAPTEKVLAYFVPSARSQYRELFNGFGAGLVEAFVPINKVVSFKVYGRIAMYKLLDESGHPATIRFFQEDDGVWRVLFYDN